MTSALTEEEVIVYTIFSLEHLTHLANHHRTPQAQTQLNGSSSFWGPAKMPKLQLPLVTIAICASDTAMPGNRNGESSPRLVTDIG